MRGPASYTGEDTVEFNCHGGPHLLGRVVEALVDQGARPAERGEFTRRAFLNGKLDLTQAEAVVDLIEASTDLGLTSAYFQLRGGLRARFEGLAEELRTALALLEAGLDFSEDVSEDTEGLQKALREAQEAVQALIGSYHLGKLAREGATVTIAGRPNVGKSTLLNRLLEEDRAIVTADPGTTRDTVEESVDLDGLRIRLIDTAGMRAAVEPAEVEGTRRSALAIEEADLVLLTVDGSEPPFPEDEALRTTVSGRHYLLVTNKSDLGQDSSWDHWQDPDTRCPLSALTGDGLSALRTVIRGTLLDDSPGDGAAITQARHLHALRRADGSLTRAVAAVADGLPHELAAVELREALEALGEIVGETTSEEILDRIFSTFCIGK